MVNDRLKAILKCFSGNDVEIAPDTSLVLDLGMNSFDFMQILYAVERDFSVRLTPEQAVGIRTVNDIMALLPVKGVSS